VLALGPADHVLEIGTGWGGFALHAARRYGCRVTTTTLSPSQAALARERVRAAGLEDRVTILEKDYRDLGGRYDKLVSIEMIEAVGHQYFETFFAQAAARLAPGGRMLLQSITIADQRFERARDDVDFIKRYIFPGCCIPSVTALLQAATAASDLRLIGLEDIGPHYAPTLACWRENLLAHVARVRELGYTEEFLRMWEFYLCYCEAGFAERALGDAQMLFERPA
jgi:cyclopropane-fatty-acyl-phospholipid synthase